MSKVRGPGCRMRALRQLAPAPRPPCAALRPPGTGGPAMCVRTVPFLAGEAWPGHSRAVMAEGSDFEEAKPDNLDARRLDIPMRPDNRADSEDLRLSGAVCRFELVRGGGDGEVARLAELQHGHIHLHQLRAAGIGKNAVAHRVRTGRLHATLPCIYLVGRPQTDVFGRMMAAALHFKGDALI